MKSCRSPDISLRPGLLSDRDRIAAFQVAMALETEDLALDLATVTRGVEAVLTDPTRGSYLLACRGEGDQEEVLACLLTLPEWSDWRNARVLWIHSVYVLPEYRGQGIYARMYRHLQAEVEEDPGLAGLRLYVDKRNTRAAAVYERLGMTREHYHLYEWL